MRKAKTTIWRDYDQKRASEPVLAAAAEFRRSTAWRRLSRLFLRAHPICGACGKELARQTHHLEPVEKRPDLALVWENLAPVCTRCHAQCNALERRGESTAQLFENFERVKIGGTF